MDAIVASLPPATVADLAGLCPREAAESVASFLTRETASGSTLFAETVAPLTDPAGPASKSARRAAEFKARARDAFVRNRFEEALQHVTTALTFAPDDARRAAPRASPPEEESVPSRASTPTSGSLRNDRAAVLLRLAAEHKSEAQDRLLFATFARLALRDASVAVTSNPKCAKARLRVGVAARALDEIETATSAFRDALRLISTTDPARVSIAKRLAEAERALSKTPKSVAASSGVTSGVTMIENTANRVDKQKKVDVRLTPDAGLGVFASKTRNGGLEPGDVVIDDEPAVASVLNKAFRATRCHFCHRAVSVAPTPCRFCVVSIYCDEACRDSDVAHNNLECGENDSGCWWMALPAETRLATRLVFFSDGEDTRTTPLHRRWADFDADARARLAATAVVASFCVKRGASADLSKEKKDFSPGAVLEATCVVLGNAFAVKSCSHPSRVASATTPDPRSAEVTRLANLVASLDTKKNPHPTPAAYLDAWRILSEEAQPVALATFSLTSRLNHSCDPNAHVELALGPLMPTRPGSGSGPEPSFHVRATTRATRRCAPHEELRVSYGPVLGSAPSETRRERLNASHGFVCACDGCLREKNAEEPSRIESGDDDDAITRRWDDIIDDARLAFESCDDDTPALNPDSAQTKKKHLRRLEAIISAARARADAMQRDDVRDSAFFFRVRKTLAEALDARALGLVTVSAVGEAASSAREALDILTRDLGYPEGDSLTIALERARVAALELACGDDGSSRKREKNAMALLRRARLVLTAALGGGTDDAAFSKSSLCLRSDWACSSCADGSLERRALFVVDALLASRSEEDASGDDENENGALYELD